MLCVSFIMIVQQSQNESHSELMAEWEHHKTNSSMEKNGVKERTEVL